MQRPALQILLLNQFYPPDVAPTGQVLHDLARVLVERDHAVRVLCSQRSYNGVERFAANEIREGVQIQRLPAFGFGRTGAAGKLADYGSYFGLLAARLLALRPRPDIIVSLTTPPFIGCLGRMAAGFHRVPHAHWIMDLYPDVLAAHHSKFEDGFLEAGLQRLARWQLHGAALVLALGPQMLNHVNAYVEPEFQDEVSRWVALWGDASLTPWPENQINPLRVERGWPAEEMVCMYSGNMGLGHRFGEFLEAARRLGAKGPRWAFAGGGKRRIEIEKFAHLHPAARIELLDYAPHNQLHASLCAADVHLASLDSRWQGLMVPSKISGILAAGKPVIFVGAAQNELAEWIASSGSGWVVPENDIACLMNALKEAQDPSERQARGRAAAEFAQKNFDMRTNCARIAQLLESAAGSHPFS